MPKHFLVATSQNGIGLRTRGSDAKGFAEVFSCALAEAHVNMRLVTTLNFCKDLDFQKFVEREFRRTSAEGPSNSLTIRLSLLYAPTFASMACCQTLAACPQ